MLICSRVMTGVLVFSHIMTLEESGVLTHALQQTPFASCIALYETKFM